MAARVTQVGAEVVGSPASKARVTQVGTEVVGSPASNARVTQTQVEVVRLLKAKNIVRVVAITT